MKILLLTLALSACAAPSFKAADCQRMRFDRWNVLICNDDSVSLHCMRLGQKYGGTTDQGNALGPMHASMGCWDARPTWYGRKGNIIVGRSYVGCVGHEVCHAEGKPPTLCDRDYPCVRK